MKGKLGEFAIEMIAAAVFFVFKPFIMAFFEGLFGDLIRGFIRGTVGVASVYPKYEEK